MAPSRATQATASGTSGSRTITVTDSATRSELPFRSDPLPSATLHLRAETGPSQPSGPERRIQWAEGVVDNEGMGRKSSKVCCIYHKPREAGESSDDESSDSSSSDDDNDGSADGGAARPAKRRRQNECNDPDHDHDATRAHGKDKGKSKQRVNAYEKAPKS